MTLYDQVFRDLCAVIHRDHPMAATLLRALRAVSTAQEACNAGLFLIAEGYRTAVPAVNPRENVTRENLLDLIFYDPLRVNQPALDLFDELLLCYQTEFPTKYFN